jgi:hypothetical protein
MNRKPRKAVTVELTPALYEAATVVSHATGRTMRDLFAKGLEREIEPYMARGEVRQAIESLRVCRESLTAG